MSKAKRLNEMIMMVNRKRRFTVGELAQEFGVSKRTILRDLQELSEMGVPLYSEVGPQGGYQVLNERILPAFAFSEDEAIAVFFAIHALRHYISLPFDTEYESIKKKFYLNLCGSLRDMIDLMLDKIDFLASHQRKDIPFLKQLLHASIHHEVLLIQYDTRGRQSERSIQPIGIYAKEGSWYCPAYCFSRKDYRVFRCDRITDVEIDSNTNPIDLSEITLTNRFSVESHKKGSLELKVALTAAGVEKYHAVQWPNTCLHQYPDGTGTVKGLIAQQDLSFFAEYLLSLGEHARIEEPAELKDALMDKLHLLVKHHGLETGSI
ncbi:YafY family protein [Bacillus sp. REN3]|uniref:helix-turn-helix transcriptional regulator n=1 Tax=Bacillus sp. REN3 TaxID=2802440 RepID=UPI001AED6F8F|nr:YafY family protein [Bacillus sp. REN3]